MKSNRPTRRSLVAGMGSIGLTTLGAPLVGAKEAKKTVTERGNIVYSDKDYKITEIEGSAAYVYAKQSKSNSSETEAIVSESRIDGDEFKKGFENVSDSIIHHIAEDENEIKYASKNKQSGRWDSGEKKKSELGKQEKSSDSTDKISATESSAGSFIERSEVNGSVNGTCGVAWNDCKHRTVMWACEMTRTGAALEAGIVTGVLELGTAAVTTYLGTSWSGPMAGVAVFAAMILAFAGTTFTIAWIDNDEAFGQLQTVDQNFKGWAYETDPSKATNFQYLGEVPGDHMKPGC